MRPILPMIVVLLAAAAPVDDAPPPGRIAGPPRQCISLGRDVQVRIQRGRILYQPNGPTWYGNAPSDCDILRNRAGVAVSTVTPTSSLCRGDVIQVFDPRSGAPWGSCSLGAFVPYTRIAR